MIEGCLKNNFSIKYPYFHKNNYRENIEVQGNYHMPRLHLSTILRDNFQEPKYHPKYKIVYGHSIPIYTEESLNSFSGRLKTTIYIY